MTLSHTELRKRFAAACVALGAPSSASFYQTDASHDGAPHIEIVASEYHYVVTERGLELQRKKTADPDELLYWLTSDVAFGMAGRYEFNHRVGGQDCRRLMFAKEIEYLSAVKSEWAARKRREIDAILRAHPYNDNLGRG